MSEKKKPGGDEGVREPSTNPVYKVRHRLRGKGRTEKRDVIAYAIRMEGVGDFG